MWGVVYHGAGDFCWEEVGKPVLQGPADAIVRVRRAGICGSDLHLWHGLPLPDRGFAVGHEFVGVVEEVGPAVRTLAPGDRVLVSCTAGCGTCEACRSGLHSGCSVTTGGGAHSNVFGFSRSLAGGQAEAVRVPFADVNAFRIPDAMDDERALFLTDALPTADMATELAAVEPGDAVVVFGCGPVGSLVQRCARLRGAARVIAVDPDPARLARARERGCEVVNPDAEDLVKRVLGLTGGRGADAIVEAVGRAELVASAVTLARPGGRIAVVGLIAAPVELPWGALLLKSLSLRTGLVSPQRHVTRLLALLESGRLDPMDLITHRLPLSRAVEAYRMLSARKGDALKVVLAA